MNRKLFVATLAASVLAASAVAGLSTARGQQQPTTKPAKPSPFEMLKPYVGGEYRIEAEWAGGGGKLNARQTWEWGLGKKFVVCKVFVARPEGGEYQRYESIFGEENGTLVAYNLDFTGKVKVTHYVVEGNAMTEVWNVKGPDGKEIPFKQTITLTDPDSYHWQVWNKMGGGDWESMMDGVWKRVGKQ